MSPGDLNLRHLAALSAIARFASISAASEAINLSQPAVAQALAKMERRLERSLFDRQPAGVVPTAAGCIFVARVDRALALIGEAGRTLRRAARLPPIAHLERIVSMGQISALIAVERAKSYAIAAREMNLSQPSVHRAVHQLELLVGMSLLTRTGRIMRATPAASRFVRAIRIALVELQAGLDELRALDLAGAGRIVVGSLPLARAVLLPRALARFAREYAHARIQIVEGPYSELLSALLEGDIDFLLGALRDLPPSQDIVQRPLFTDELHIVARTDHPLCGPQPPNPRRLAEYPWVVGAKASPMRRTLDNLFARHSLEPAVQVETGSIIVARGILLHGDWLALMSPDQFRMERAAGLLASVGPPLPYSRREIGITTRANWHATQNQADFIELLATLAATETPKIEFTDDALNNVNAQLRCQSALNFAPGESLQVNAFSARMSFSR